MFLNCIKRQLFSKQMYLKCWHKFEVAAFLIKVFGMGWWRNKIFYKHYWGYDVDEINIFLYILLLLANPIEQRCPRSLFLFQLFRAGHPRSLALLMHPSQDQSVLNKKYRNTDIYAIDFRNIPKPHLHTTNCVIHCAIVFNALQLRPNCGCGNHVDGLLLNEIGSLHCKVPLIFVPF